MWQELSHSFKYQKHKGFLHLSALSNTSSKRSFWDCANSLCRIIISPFNTMWYVEREHFEDKMCTGYYKKEYALGWYNELLAIQHTWAEERTKPGVIIRGGSFATGWTVTNTASTKVYGQQRFDYVGRAVARVECPYKQKMRVPTCVLCRNL